MNCVAAYDTLIDSVYESMRSPERLSAALSATKTFLNADTCHLIGWDRSTLEPTLKISTASTPDVDSEFARRCDSDVSSSPSHRVLITSDLVPEAPDLLVLGVRRHAEDKHFGADEVGWFERLAPHFRRVLTMLYEQHLHSHAALIKGVGDELSHLAIFALDETGRLLEANECANAQLRAGDPLRLCQDRLMATCENASAAFTTKLRDALNGQTTHLTLSNATRERHLCVTLLPAPLDPMQTLSHRRMAVVVIACDTAPKRVATATQLMEYFSLTAAEARLVRALCRGEDVQSYATNEGLKVSTVRSHVKAALEKAGTATQKELVRMVTAIPAVRV